MKRDLELIRQMVLAIEDAPGWAPRELTIDGYTCEEIRYHAYLLIDARLAEGFDTTNLGSPAPEAMIRNLTWAGHEFAEAARDESRWKKAMGIVGEKGGSITLDILTQLLGSLMRGAFGL